MKTRTFVIFLGVLLAALTLVLLVPRRTAGQTQAGTPDALATALTNAGLDPTQAPAWATAIELALASQMAFVSATNNSIAALQNSVASLSAQLAAVDLQIAPPTRSSAIGYTVPIPAVILLGASALPNIGTFPEGIILGGPGSFYDYAVNVPTSGQYSISASLSSSAGGTLTFHLEDPVGVPGPSVTYAGTPGFTNVSGPALAFGAGPQVIRFVVDVAAGSTFRMNWLYLTRLS